MRLELIAILAMQVFSLGYLAKLLRQRSRLLQINEIERGHVDALATTLKATGDALDLKTAAAKTLADSLLFQVNATLEHKKEAERLERELAMAEETIHVLSAKEKRGKNGSSGGNRKRRQKKVPASGGAKPSRS